MTPLLCRLAQRLCLSTLILLSIGCDGKEEADRQMRDFEREVRKDSARIDADILEQKVRYVRIKLGDGEGSLYELCHTHRPTTAEHIHQCAQVDKEVAKAEQEDEKHPW
jgi:hypothetical protein